MKEVKILLIGQPNIGKSSLLNALVGPMVVVSNYPGTTVEVTKAKKIFNNTKINFVDTPGIYSISDRSEEEKVTEKSLFEQKIDGAIVIADAISLERSLYMMLQILEARVPTVLALNFIEDAKQKGIVIDCEKLEKFLCVPVIPINPLTKKGIDKLVNAVLKIKKTPKRTFNIEYDDHIEKAINKISPQVNLYYQSFGIGVKEISISKRFIALRVLEGDQDFYKYLKDEKVIEEAKKGLKEHPKVAEDISITRYGTASFIAEKVTQIKTILKKKAKLQEKIDNIFLDKTWGPISTLFSLLIIFGIVLYLGNWLQGIFMGWTENFLSSFGPMQYSPLKMVLVQGLTGLSAGISIALPYVFLFYLFLGLLEDIGLLSRFIANSEKFLKKLGLSGKSFIPLMLGLGCTVPATRATRILSSKKEQFHTASLFAFVPCSSRMAIIMGIVGFYGGIALALGVLATSFFAGLIWALGIKKIFHLKSKPLLLELPPYRKPLITNVLAKSWVRMKDFVYIVIPFLILGGVTYGILAMIGFDQLIVKPFSFITTWLGLPALAIIPLIFGFLQKDLTGAMLVSVLGSKISLVLTPLQLYSFGVAAAIGVPCIIALGILAKEFNFKKAITLTMFSIIYGLFLAGLISKLILHLF